MNLAFLACAAFFAINMPIFAEAKEFKKVKPQYACGPIFGAIGINLKSGVSNKQLASAIEKKEWAREKYKLSLWGGQNRDASVYARIKKEGRYGLIFPVPQGSETFIAKELLKTGLVSSAGLPGAGCSGDEYVVVTTNPKIVGDLRNVKSLKKFVSTRLNSMIDSCTLKTGSTCGQAIHLRSRVNRIPPYFPSVVFELTSVSELTRGTKTNNVWDKVEVHARLWHSGTKTQHLWIHTEDYRRARKAKKKVPTIKHFSRPSGDVRYGRESRIAITLGEHASSRKGVTCTDATLDADDRQLPTEHTCSKDDTKLRDQFYIRYVVK